METATAPQYISEHWTPAMLEAWESTKPVIYNVLRRFEKEKDVEDVHQDTWIAADAGLHTYDRTKGEFGAWLRRISRNCAYTHIRTFYQPQDKIHTKLTQTVGLDASLVQVQHRDFAEEICDEAGALDHLGKTLRILASVINEDKKFFQTLIVIVKTESNVSQAATLLDLKRRSLAHNYVQALETAFVISNALDIYAYRQESRINADVMMREIISCIPRDTEYSHIAQLMLDTGCLETAQQLHRESSASVSLADRQFNRTMRLLSIARAIIEKGNI